MRTLIRAGLLAIGLVGLAGCSTAPPPSPQAKPLPKPDPEAEEMARRREASRFQQEVVMAEVARTHPVLSATLDRNMTKLREALKKRGKVNEVRRDMRLGPPLREACRLKWREGIDELTSHGAQCLGDSACESCVRGMAPRPSGVAPSGSTFPGTAPRQPPASTVPRAPLPGTAPRPLPPATAPRSLPPATAPRSVPLGTPPRQAPSGVIRPAP